MSIRRNERKKTESAAAPAAAMYYNDRYIEMAESRAQLLCQWFVYVCYSHAISQVLNYKPPAKTVYQTKMKWQHERREKELQSNDIYAHFLRLINEELCSPSKVCTDDFLKWADAISSSSATFYFAIRSFALLILVLILILLLCSSLSLSFSAWFCVRSHFTNFHSDMHYLFVSVP